MGNNGNGSNNYQKGNKTGQNGQENSAKKQQRNGNKENYGDQNLPSGYSETPYFLTGTDGKRIPERKFIGEYAKDIARKLGSGSADLNKSTQIRKFFDFARRVEAFLKSGNMTFEEAMTELERLNGFVNYAKERNKVSMLFVRFINANLNRINDDEDLYFFIKHFEAVVGYSKYNK